ncbi:substrate-binding periplasmic protein [Azospirillum himalayense]|uniref:Substrate-binding periplasmic protein n=1 Tax=Azospirillum himalayense TaxID=654847 RepID=A0ABW0G9M4_9PROT
MTRKILGLACAALLGSAVPAAAQTSIQAASDVGFAPYSMATMDGSFEGIDIDIAKGMSKYSGIDIKVIQQPWSTTFAGLKAKKFDAMWSAAAITPERAKSMAFLEGYGEAIDAVLQRASDKKIKTIDDLQGKTIAINKGSSADAWLTERQDKHKITISRFETSPDAVQAVLSGQVDGYMMYQTAAGFASLKNPLLQVSDFVVKKGVSYGYAVNPDNIALRNKLDAALECMKTSGELDAIFKRWTGITPEPNGVTNTPAPGYGEPGATHYEDTPHEPTCG